MLDDVSKFISLLMDIFFFLMYISGGSYFIL